MNDWGIGFGIAAIMFIPVALLEMFIGFKAQIPSEWLGAWSLFFMLPYLIYFGVAFIFYLGEHSTIGKGIAIGGAIFSTLIIIGLVFLALLMSAANE